MVVFVFFSIVPLLTQVWGEKFDNILFYWYLLMLIRFPTRGKWFPFAPLHACAFLALFCSWDQDKMLPILSRCLQWHCSIPWISVTESYRIYTVAVTSPGVTRFVVKCCQFLQDRNLSALSVSHPTRNTRRVSCSFQLGHAIQAFQACDRVLSNDASMHPRSSDWRNPYRFNRCNSM